MKKLTPNKVNESTGPLCRTDVATSLPAPSLNSDLTPPASVPEELISREEVARRLHKSIRTIANWQRRGIIPFVKIENSTWFNWPVVVAHLANSGPACKRPAPLRIPVIVMSNPSTKECK